MQTLTQTRLQLRPIVNYAPLEDGIEFQHWDHTFAIKGQPALYRLFQTLLPALEGGTDLTGILHTLPEKAQKAAHWLLDELSKRDALVGVEDRPDVGLFEQTWSYLLAVAQRPREAFLNVRQATIEVQGEVGLARITAATLARLGIGKVLVHFDPEEDLLLSDPALARADGTRPDLTLYALQEGPIPHLTGKALQGMVGRERGIIAPLGEGAPLKRALDLLRQPLGEGPIPETTRNLFSNLLALEAFRAIAEVPTPVAREEAVLIETALLSSKTVKLPAAAKPISLQEAMETVQAQESLTRSERLNRLGNLSSPVLGLLPDVQPVGVQVPLFAYGMRFPEGLVAGWGADGEEAQDEAFRAALLHLIGQAQAPETGWNLQRAQDIPVDARTWVTATGADFADWTAEGIRQALLQEWKAGQRFSWTSQTVSRHDLPLPATWLYKALPLIYQHTPTLEVVRATELPSLNIAVVRSGDHVLGAAAHEDFHEAWLRALKMAVGGQQLRSVALNAPQPFVHPEASQGETPLSPGNLQAELEQAGFTVTVHPWTAEPGLAQVLVGGWVTLHA